MLALTAILVMQAMAEPTRESSAPTTPSTYSFSSDPEIIKKLNHEQVKTELEVVTSKIIEVQKRRTELEEELEEWDGVLAILNTISEHAADQSVLTIDWSGTIQGFEKFAKFEAPFTIEQVLELKGIAEAARDLEYEIIGSFLREVSLPFELYYIYREESRIQRDLRLLSSRYDIERGKLTVSAVYEALVNNSTDALLGDSGGESMLGRIEGAIAAGKEPADRDLEKVRSILMGLASDLKALGLAEKNWENAVVECVGFSKKWWNTEIERIRTGIQNELKRLESERVSLTDVQKKYQARLGTVGAPSVEWAKLLVPLLLVVILLAGTYMLFRQVISVGESRPHLAELLIQSNISLEIISLTLIVSTILTLALNGYLTETSTAMYTLLGTLAGYVLGRSRPSKLGNQSDDRTAGQSGS